MNNINELLLEEVFVNLLSKNNVYSFDKVDKIYCEKINHIFSVSSWVFYVEGNINRACERGILFCKECLIVKTDKGDIISILFDELHKTSIANTNDCIIVNGNTVTIYDCGSYVYNCILRIKREYRFRSSRRVVKVSDNRISEDDWYYLYDNNIFGPYNIEDFKEKLKELYELHSIQVWNVSLDQWKFLDELDDFIFLFSYEKEKNSDTKMIDINNCSFNDLISIEGITIEAATIFIDKRDKGFFIRNLSEFQSTFKMKPHQIEKIKNNIIFKTKEKKNKRLLDL